VPCGAAALAYDDVVESFQKISATQGNFGGTLDFNDCFGCAQASLSDLDGDGVVDLAVGAFRDDDGGDGRGAVWILFLNSDGTVKSHQKISNTEGGFTGTLDNDDLFGESVANIGDLDGDDVIDIAVGAADDDGGYRRGAVWVLFLDNDGTVKSYQKISDTEGGFTGVLHDNNNFGHDVDAIGDLDGDGVVDLAVGANRDNDGGTRHGAVWILFMNSDGTVKAHQKISDTQGGFEGTFGFDDKFGHAVEALSDLDGDGIVELAVGARQSFGDPGKVFILFMQTDGTVRTHQEISESLGNFGGDLDDNDAFGSSVTSVGDLDGDGVSDLVVAAPRDDDGGLDRGAAWILFLNSDGTVKSEQKISDTEGGFLGVLDDSDSFGSRDWIIDLGGDGGGDLTLVVAAVGDDDGGPDRGAVWLLFLEATCPEDPDPSSQGYWHRQCLGVPASEGGIDPGRNGRGPDSPTEPDFVPDLMDCADHALEDLGLYGTLTCDGMDANPPSDPCQRAEKQLTALILNVCSGRVLDGCEVDVSAEGCSSTTVGDLLDEIATLILMADCNGARSCAAAVNEGIGLVDGGGGGASAATAESDVEVNSSEGLRERRIKSKRQSSPRNRRDGTR
jgi:hypothetical protein